MSSSNPTPIPGTLNATAPSWQPRDSGERRALGIANGRNVDHELARLIAGIAFVAVLAGALTVILVGG